MAFVYVRGKPAKRRRKASARQAHISQIPWIIREVCGRCLVFSNGERVGNLLEGGEFLSLACRRVEYRRLALLTVKIDAYQWNESISFFRESEREITNIYRDREREEGRENGRGRAG